MTPDDELQTEEYEEHDKKKYNEEEDLNLVESKPKRYPKHVVFIIGNEFCERFSYYGMRSVLWIYMRNYLKWDNDEATQAFHSFVFLAYFFPLFGAIIADSYWGKYSTIYRLSIVYIFGNLFITVSSIPYAVSGSNRAIYSMVGLLLIAIGTGGIKPCVSSFGGDQFTPDLVQHRKQFFSFFYFAINAGALISTFLTPFFRADVDCYPGEEGPEFDECYALAFGVPASLMMVALILFLAGTKWYVIYPPTRSIFLRACSCIGSAFKNKFGAPADAPKKEHWLDYANAPPILIRDTKYALRVLVLFIPLPVFWALFDQQSSRWTLQAISTNGYLGELLIRPDQVETLNPLLIVTLIPLFEATLFPFLKYLKIPFSPLRRMTAGLLLAGLSFIVSGIVQLKIEKSATALPASDSYGIRVIRASTKEDCSSFNYSLDDVPGMPLAPKEATPIQFFRFEHEPIFRYTVQCEQSISDAKEKIFPDKKQLVVDIIIDESGNLNKLHMITTKTEDGGGRFSVVNLDNFYKQRKLAVFAEPLDRGTGPERPTFVEYGKRSAPIDVPYGKVEIIIYDAKILANFNQTLGSNDTNPTLLRTHKFYLDVGESRTVIFQEKSTYDILDLNPNTISVAWMIPQFVIITIGEVFLSITGLEFSYTQAPPSMKSVLSSIWLLTVSLGNVIVIIVAKVKVAEKLSTEMFSFAGLIFLATLLFIYLAGRYVPVDENEFREELLASGAKEMEETDLEKPKVNSDEEHLLRKSSQDQ